jgi:hypothetical protein
MRVIRDEVTGGLLVAEAGTHGPFAEPRFHHAHLLAAGIPHERIALGAAVGSNGHHRHDHEETPAMSGAAG